MTFQEIYDEYNRQIQIYQKESQEYLNNHKSWKGYNGFEVDYNGFEKAIVEALQSEFGFTPNQAGYIYGNAYQHHHAYFNDVIWAAQELGETIRNFPKA